MVSSMTWLSDLTNRVVLPYIKRPHNVPDQKNNRTNHNGKPERPPTLGILAFEAARAMSHLVSLYQSISEEQVSRLRKKVMRSQGVAYLNSMDETFLLKLACAEKIEDLDRLAVSVARFGKKCSDPGLTQFEVAYADLKLGFIDLEKLNGASKEIERIVDRMEKLITATSNLHAELEALNDMEAMDRKIKQWKEQNGSVPVPKNDFTEQKFNAQKKIVQRLQDASLWNQPYDKIVGSMARTVCVVYARICVVFGPQISILQNASSRHVRFSSLQLDLEHKELAQDQELETESVTSKSGPISKSLSVKPAGHMRHWGEDMKPLGGENIGFRIGNKENHENGFGWIQKTTRLVQQAPPRTVGGSGLALRYASVIMALEKCLEYPSSLTEVSRDDIYKMLPEKLNKRVSTKLKKLYRNQTEFGCNHIDESIAQGWKDGLRVIMGWLAPMAHDTLTWMKERNFEKSSFEWRSTVLLLQTLYFADREKTEATIVDILVGLSFICRYTVNHAEGDKSHQQSPS